MTRHNTIDKSLSYTWLPGSGPSTSALARLQELAPRPSNPPGEAWFMGKTRRMYTEFIEEPLSTVSGQVLKHFLFEATTGVVSFHDIPEEVASWRAWYAHLLPGMIVRGDESYAFHYLIEAVITAFLRLHTNCTIQENSNFRSDVLETMGKAIMMPSLWDENGESICAQYQDWQAHGSLWPKCGGAISASLFFCLTLLETDEVQFWTESIFEIQSAYFQAHFLTWLVASHEILKREEHCFENVSRSRIDIKWDNSSVFEKVAPRIPMANRSKFLQTVRNVLDVERIYGYIKNISRYEELSVPFASARIAEDLVDVVLPDID